MNTLETTYCYRDSDGNILKEHRKVDLDIIKQWSLQEIRMICVINFIAPIDPIIDDVYLEEDNKPKRFKLEYEQVSSLFVSKTIFYQTIKKLINKGIVKRESRNIYSVSKAYFPLAENGGTSIAIFHEFDNYPM